MTEEGYIALMSFCDNAEHSSIYANIFLSKENADAFLSESKSMYQVIEDSEEIVLFEVTNTGEQYTPISKEEYLELYAPDKDHYVAMPCEFKDKLNEIYEIEIK